jgi:hypothetical protein
MIEQATEVKNVLIPIFNPTDDNGRKWLTFKYGEADKDPWKWPKVIKYQDKLYVWMSWNSDDYRVNYKEIKESELATIVKRKR